jgi:hypothetical protein
MIKSDVQPTAPWTFHRIPTYKDARDHLQHNELIHVRSEATGKYLAVEVGITSIIDRLGFASSRVDGTRWTVR